MAQAHPYHQFFNSAAAKLINVNSDTFKLMLLTNLYVPNYGTHQYQSSLTHELPSGNGYTTGGSVISGVATGLTSVSCQQVVTPVGSPTGGTFMLTVVIGANSQTTTAIPINSTPSVVQAAIAALPNVGTGNVSVSGATGGPWTVMFTGSLSAQAIPEMGVTPSLSGGSFPGINVSISVAGVGSWEVTGGNVVWSSATFVSPNAARYAAMVDVTPGSASANPLVAFVDFVTDQSPSSSTLSVSWDATGIVVVNIS